MKLRLFALAALLAALAGCRPEAPVSGESPASRGGQLRVSFLDVGQGDSALVQLPGGKSVLIDGGPSGAGPKVIDAIRGAGVNRIDLLIGSHPHEDHIGGLMDVLKAVPVTEALDPAYVHGTALQRNYLQLLKTKGVKTTRARAGQRYDLGPNAGLEILAPEDPLIKGTQADANNNSIVARLVYGKTAFLFTGDMEEAERQRLLQNTVPDALRANVLKVAHHGSHNGTDPELLKAVAPEYAVISLARGNDYGHPHREALEQLRSAGIPVLRTDERGTVAFTSDGERVKLLGAPVQRPTRVESPARPETPAVARRVIGNRTSKVYHSPDCAALPSPGNRVELASEEEARSQGYRPHAACLGRKGGSE